MKKKLIILCMALGLSLTFAQASFAVMTLDVDPASLADGLYTSGSPGIISTKFGDIEFVGEIRNSGDSDLPGKVFDVSRSQTASLTFNFVDPYIVLDVTFKYGGNQDVITVEARDISDTVIDSLVNAPTGNGASVGPVTLYGNLANPIYKLTWNDPGVPNTIKYDLASLNNITLSIIPAPGAVLLGSIGVGIVGWLRRKKTL